MLPHVFSAVNVEALATFFHGIQLAKDMGCLDAWVEESDRLIITKSILHPGADMSVAGPTTHDICRAALELNHVFRSSSERM
ncbi:hypothetical protein SLE2022_157810 [Rubroshorea leprosula]